MVREAIWPSVDDYHTAAAHALAALAASGIRARLVGSYAEDRLSPPYSDLDVLVIAPTRDGSRVRDAVIETARAMEEALCVSIDPFDRQAIVFSILASGLRVDWFIVEEVDGEEQPVWRGERRQPIDVTCRAWSSLLSTLSVLLKTDDAESKRQAGLELAEHWVWLSANGVDVSSLPHRVPRPTDDVHALIAATARILPPNDSLSRILLSRL